MPGANHPDTHTEYRINEDIYMRANLIKVSCLFASLFLNLEKRERVDAFHTSTNKIVITFTYHFEEL